MNTWMMAMAPLRGVWQGLHLPAVSDEHVSQHVPPGTIAAHVSVKTGETRVMKPFSTGLAMYAEPCAACVAACSHSSWMGYDA
jgi:hypothetical protein